MKLTKTEIEILERIKDLKTRMRKEKGISSKEYDELEAICERLDKISVFRVSS